MGWLLYRLLAATFVLIAGLIFRNMGKKDATEFACGDFGQCRV
jgi:hypothetical protein